MYPNVRASVIDKEQTGQSPPCEPRASGYFAGRSQVTPGGPYGWGRAQTAERTEVVNLRRDWVQKC